MKELLRDRVGRAILLVALLVRLAFFAEVALFDLDLSKNDQLDMIYLHENAKRIADGDLRLVDQYLGHYDDVRTLVYGPERFDRLFGRHTYHDSPGYLYFAALCEKIGGRSPYAVVLVQELLDVLGCAFVYIIARRLGGLATARVAIAAAALCLECVAEAGFVLRESVLAFLATSSVLALTVARDRGTLASWLVAGLVLGVGWTFKLTFALLLAAGPLLAWRGPKSATPGRDRAARVGAFALGAIVAVAPFAIRNVSLGVPPLRMAVTPTYLIVQRNLPGYMGAAEYARHAEVRAILERSDDTTLGAWVATVRSHPSARSYVDQLGRKLHFFWLGVDFWNNIRCSYLRLLSPILAACVVWWGVLGPWTALGVVRALASRARRRDALPLVAAFLSLGIATALASGVYTRYRMVVAPLACVLFALTVVDAATHISKKSWLPRAVGAGVVLLGVVLHLAWRDPQPPLTPDALTGYVAGTWPHSRRARDHLLERVERSRSR